ncbi:MAG TPA: hypothetical protein VEC12_04220 [Bacteroidia bacterium]|nr:hypothetical protein [Bacteroidia bacterium]
MKNPYRFNLLLLLCALAVFIGGCSFFAVTFAPKKKAVQKDFGLKTHAVNYFWQHFHSGNYDSIPEMLNLLTAAYLKNPNDPEIARYIGFTHLWALAESERIPESEVKATITDHAVMARKYFEEAHELEPKNGIATGFLASCLMAEGTIHNSQKEIRKGYFMLNKAIRQWPEFNYFTAGYNLSGMNYDSKIFNKAVEYQWKNIEICIGEKLDRTNPDIFKLKKMFDTTGRKSPCWNGYKAPHNFEGFMMNMGDMLVKKGDVKTALVIYNNTKFSTTYNSWPFKHLLEERIADAEQNIPSFRGETEGTAMMFQSAITCVSCHQQ